jgi:hypothetical protein
MVSTTKFGVCEGIGATCNSYCRVLLRGTQPLKDMVSLEEYMLAMSFHQCLIRALSAVKLDLWFLKVRIQNSPDFFAYKISSNFSLQAAYCISFFALLQQFTYISSGPPESVEEKKWQVQDEEFDVEKEDDNSSELPLQKLRPAYSLLGPISKVPRPRSTSTKDRR